MRAFHTILLILSFACAIAFYFLTAGPSAATNEDSSEDKEIVGPSSSSKYDNGALEDKKATPSSFLTFTIQMPPSGTYVDTIEVNSTSKMDVMGMQTTMSTGMHMESKRVVTDLPDQGGSIAVDTVVTRASMLTSVQGTMGESQFACDTSDEMPVEDKVQKAMCQPFYGLLDSSSHFVLDEQGNIADASGPGVELVKGMAANNNNINNKPSQDPTTGKISPTNTLEQMSRILKFLPTQPVEENSEWDTFVDMGDDMGQFEGKSKFTGEIDYSGVQCAVFESSGTLRLNLDKVFELMGDNVAALMNTADVHVLDGTFQATICWDEANKISRWSTTHLETEITMKNPLDDASTMSLPITETVTVKTDIEG